ncbi:M28 family peptidase [Paraliomyxa miuraensis]|uniref:M28 family peptidase n=1 Tax=Paraliomyxa miuraensis TaxID=376150 RepID=UPI00225B67BF|nr:M28 family peptidase [Paraliomyxa miuraensis]MCX4244400.1 M28 family peptidase [Paraliomyxa miuraensis]
MDASAPPARAGSPGWTLLLLVLVVGFAALRQRPPDPAPTDAPATEFSAMRAHAMLERIVGDGAPHGVGTTANAAVRDRIETELRALGLPVERQTAISCRRIVCAPVVNLLARVPGAHEGGPAVLLVSHYDSVHAGPGVGDDLHGAAVMLEVARALGASAALEHPVWLLFDEGEEVGLLGATAFVEQHPAVHDVAVVINIEARGSSGLSSMFETSEGNAELVGAYLSHAPRPQATSLAYEVYRRMPNDTDLTVFKAAGHGGLNFGFVGGVAHYHTPLDDLAHLNPGSVQHQGDNVLAATRALASAPLPRPAASDAIYADVLGLCVVRWPEGGAIPMAVLPVVLLLGLGVVARQRGRLAPRRAVLGMVAVLGTVVLTVALAFGLARLVSGIVGEPVPAYASPLALRVALWSIAVGVALWLAKGLSRWASALELGFGVWLTWALAAIGLAVQVPGASVVLCLPLVPAVAGMAVAVLGGPRHEPTGLQLAGVLMTAMWATLALALEDVFGLGVAAVVAAPIAVSTTALLPALVPAREARGWARAAFATAAIATVVACLVPIHDEDHPRRIALVHYDDRATGSAMVAALALDGLPTAIREAGSLAEEPTAALPWTGRRVHAGPAAPGTAPPPRLDLVDRGIEGGAAGEIRRVRARLRSSRGADQAVVLLPPERLAGVWVEGRPLATASGPMGRVMVFGLPAHGWILDLEIHGPKPLEATVIDCEGGLAESAQALATARDQAGAVTIQWGDQGCIGTRATL